MIGSRVRATNRHTYAVWLTGIPVSDGPVDTKFVDRILLDDLREQGWADDAAEFAKAELAAGRVSVNIWEEFRAFTVVLHFERRGYRCLVLITPYYYEAEIQADLVRDSLTPCEGRSRYERELL